jgi:GAF domain-containing protein
VIGVGRAEPGPFSDHQIALLQTFADQAVIAIENVRLFKELESRNAALTETLNQQTATAEILGVLSASPTQVQPVFDAIVASAVRLCDGMHGAILRVDGNTIDHVAQFGHETAVLEEIRRHFPQPMDYAAPSSPVRAIRERRVVEVPDTETTPGVPDFIREAARRQGFRSELWVPMLHGENAIGTIVVTRREPGRFTDKQIALLQTFADQAVIAIENVRLFKELEEKNRALTKAHAQATESLEQQTATSEILRVISSSPTDLQPVFDAIVESASKLCGGQWAVVVRLEGDLIHLAAQYNARPGLASVAERLYPRPLGREVPSGRAILEGAVVHIPDAEEEGDAAIDPALGQIARSFLAVPMLQEGMPIGAIGVSRATPGPFTPEQIALLKTFADQAVIAIENVRLFNALEERNTALTEALERQTATSEILRVISQSPSDVGPVLETIVRNAVRLCGAHRGGFYRFDGALIHSVTNTGLRSEELEAWRRTWPQPVTSATIIGLAIRDKRIVRIGDIESSPEMSGLDPGRRAQLRAHGSRSLVVVPIRREEEIIGAIGLAHPHVDAFSDAHVELLRTFADQAVIAIENVRLFTELQEKNRALTQAHAQVSEALEQQTATSDILRVISQSPTDVRPVFEAIAQSAARLTNAVLGATFTVAGDMLHLVGTHVPSGESHDAFTRAYPIPLDDQTVATRVARDRIVVNIGDTTAEPSLPKSQAQRLLMFGVRSVLMVPMVRDAQTLGMILAARRLPSAFTETQVQLLQTFADQAVIAIENVRLFTELQDKNRALTEALDQQTATSDILRVISSSPTDAQPVFDTIVRNATRLCRARAAAVFVTDGPMLYEPANYGGSPEALAATRARYPRPLDRETAAGTAILTRSVVQVPDVEEPSAAEFAEFARRVGRAVGFRSLLSVPMLREGEAVGAINITRPEPGRFSDAELALLKTFADQAVIAIENVRLFKALEARTQDLTRSVGELRALGEVGQAISSTLDLDTVLETIVTRAAQLSGADAGSIYEYDERTGELSRRAVHNMEAEILARPDQRFRRGEGALGQAVARRQPVQFADISDPAVYESKVRDLLLRFGYRALLAVPLVREDQIIGALVVNRKAPGEFPQETVALLTTFATQSALAIQNARLFREIADKSRQLEVASQHKSEFLANMSHELRTPLNAIIGFSEVLSERLFGELNEKQEEYLKDIHASGQHLLSLINDILDLSKIEAGRMELELTDFDLPTAIDNALILVRERAGRRGITLHQAADAGLGQIRGDERKIKQVLLNLLSNAIKFTPDGGRIDVRAMAVDGAVEVSVSDTGVGIAPEDQEAIFEEFRQVGTAAKKVEGTGLGLALSRKFIELHGGRIWVRSQLGVGSTFTFTIPVQRGR